ncbi:MAG: hypothetical protein KDD51_09365, partial [Bdellovibrionales bacterium]|nr:hypothetical protein [Bdellovibrionales bacterium]
EELAHGKTRQEKTDSDVLRNYVTDLAASFDVHPPSGKRLERIILQNPKIRKILGCSDSKLYCT